MTREDDEHQPAAVLSEFHDLRCALAKEVHGNPGMFAGFNDLTWHAARLPELIEVVATVRHLSARHHEVVFEAREVLPDGEAGGLIVRGSGSTIAHPSDTKR